MAGPCLSSCSNGFVDREELAALLESLMGSQIEPDLPNALIQVRASSGWRGAPHLCSSLNCRGSVCPQIVDVDGDGNVSLAEFLERLTEQKTNWRQRVRRGSGSTASEGGSLMEGVTNTDPMSMPLSQLQAVIKKKPRRERRQAKQQARLQAGRDAARRANDAGPADGRTRKIHVVPLADLRASSQLDYSTADQQQQQQQQQQASELPSAAEASAAESSFMSQNSSLSQWGLQNPLSPVERSEIRRLRG